MTNLDVGSSSIRLGSTMYTLMLGFLRPGNPDAAMNPRESREEVAGPIRNEPRAEDEIQKGNPGIACDHGDFKVNQLSCQSIRA